MIFLDGKKFACSACIRGHRASSCNHSSRELTEIRPKGRPVTQCERCRQLRKTRKAHVKCLCSEMDSASPAVDSPTIQDLLNPCKCSASDICVCCRPVISDYINRNYTLEVVEEEAADTLVQIRAEPIVMSAPAVSRAVEASDGVTAVCPSGPNASCCQAEQSSNEDLPSHPGSRELVLPGSAPQLRELNLPRFKVERRSNGVPAPQTNPSEQFQPGSAPQFREPNARRTERSSSITHRTLDRHVNGEEQHHHSRHQYSKAYSPGSAVTAAFGHDSGVQLSPNGMHYSEAAPGGDGRPNCKCGCDCGTFLDTLIRAIEDRVRGAVPLVDAEANGDAAAMNRFIREILSPLDNPLLLPISGERGRQRQGSESAGSHSHGSESYDAGDDVRFELDDPSGLDDPIDTGASSFAAGIGVPAAASCCASRPDPGRAQKTPLARAAPAGRSCCSSLVPTLYAPSQASCCAGGGEVAGSSSNGKVANNGQCCSSGDGGSGGGGKPCNCSCRKRKRTWQPGDPEHPEIDSDGALACNCGCHKPYQECTDCLDDQCEQTLFGAP